MSTLDLEHDSHSDLSEHDTLPVEQALVYATPREQLWADLHALVDAITADTREPVLDLATLSAHTQECPEDLRRLDYYCREANETQNTVYYHPIRVGEDEVVGFAPPYLFMRIPDGRWLLIQYPLDTDFLEIAADAERIKAETREGYHPDEPNPVGGDAHVYDTKEQVVAKLYTLIPREPLPPVLRRVIDSAKAACELAEQAIEAADGIVRSLERAGLDGSIIGDHLNLERALHAKNGY